MFLSCANSLSVRHVLFAWFPFKASLTPNVLPRVGATKFPFSISPVFLPHPRLNSPHLIVQKNVLPTFSLNAPLCVHGLRDAHCTMGDGSQVLPLGKNRWRIQKSIPSLFLSHTIRVAAERVWRLAAGKDCPSSTTPLHAEGRSGEQGPEESPPPPLRGSSVSLHMSQSIQNKHHVFLSDCDQVSASECSLMHAPCLSRASSQPPKVRATCQKEEWALAVDVLGAK